MSHVSLTSERTGARWMVGPFAPEPARHWVEAVFGPPPAWQAVLATEDLAEREAAGAVPLTDLRAEVVE